MRREALALVVLAVLLLFGWVGYQAMFGAGGQSPLLITSVEGDVRKVDGTGGTVAAVVGLRVGAQDRLSAASGGRATLSLGADTRLTLDENSSIRVTAVNDEEVKLELEGGKMQATVKKGGGKVGVASKGREVQAVDADFSAGVSVDGTLAVEASRGDLSVTGVPGATSLASGQRLVTAEGGSPLLSAVSDQLLLNVDWPETRQRAEVVVVTGVTEPGARVLVTQGSTEVEARANAKGEFTVRVALLEGENRVKVRAVSVLGNSADIEHALERDTTPPTVGLEIRP